MFSYKGAVGVILDSWTTVQGSPTTHKQVREGKEKEKKEKEILP